MPVLTYLYGTWANTNQIVGVRDADGVEVEIGYDASGRVDEVRRSGAPTEMVTTYEYATNTDGTRQVTIRTSAGIDSLPSRIVRWRDDLGGQVVSSTLHALFTDDPTTTVDYDEYGQVRKVTDPVGNMTRTERDGRGNALVVAEHDAEGVLLRQTRAEYDRDHVVSSVDVNGNETAFAYDHAWRPVSTLTVVADSAGEGSSSTLSAYDEWGNPVTTAPGDSTAYNLLRNGTLDLDPFLLGNGWDGWATGAQNTWLPVVDQFYVGTRALRLYDPAGEACRTSEAISVRGSTGYALSAWMQGAGRVRVFEYDEAGALKADTVVLNSGAAGASAFERGSAAFLTRPETVRVHVRPQSASGVRFDVDNIRLELANAASSDSFVENQSMERIAAGLPQAWHRRSTSLTTAIHEQSSDAAVSGRSSAAIEHVTGSGDGYFTSDSITVRGGETYTFAVSIKTEDSSGGVEAEVAFYNATGGLVENTTHKIARRRDHARCERHFRLRSWRHARVRERDHAWGHHLDTERLGRTDPCSRARLRRHALPLRARPRRLAAVDCPHPPRGI
ncbi:MAG: hypothetical protein VB139_02765 [Coriobacteriia bacterium]|nr:hypothetical protein [Coriobacteriia bacterium]